jgi:uncharacterized damage-inducible protein DinB
MSTIISRYAYQLEQEAPVTRKFLELVPTEQFNFKPHEKSMTLERLATHVAELPAWVGMAINTEGLDFATNPYPPETVANREELLAYFDRNLADARKNLATAKDDILTQPWTLSNGDHKIFTSPKDDVLRVSMSQIIHHRAQLGVYLRLLNIPIPGSYGPSADELGM